MKDGAGASKHLVLLSDYLAMHTLTKGIFHDNLLLQSIQDCIRAVVEEEGFHLPSKEAEAALNSAKSLSKWFEGEQSRKAVEEFNNKLETSLKECIQNAVQQGSSVDAQCLWSSYQKLIVSPAFRANSNWEGFFRMASVPPSALVYQSATQKLMDCLVRKQLPIPEASTSSQVQELTYIEENVLRYVCGYIIKALKNKLTKSLSNPKHLILGLDSMITEDGEGDGRDVGSDSTEWIHCIDRGGLIHVNQLLFFSIEMEVRKFFRGTGEEQYNEKRKEAISDAVCSDIDVRYYWDVCQHELEVDERAELLPLLVNHYITVRGFSFVRSLLEKYKQMHKKTTQKSKALRKKVSK